MTNKSKFLYLIVFIVVLNQNLTIADPFILVIDPGHGGKDPGTVSKNKKYKEKNICLQVAKKIREATKLAIPDCTIILTRENDKFLSLRDRQIKINNCKPNLLISIHINSCQDTSARGCEIYVMSQKARWPSFGITADLKKANVKTMERYKVALTENQVIFLDRQDKEDYKKNILSAHSKILTNICSDANLRNSHVFAANLKKFITRFSNMYPVKVIEGGFILLWKVIAPSVLIELGFISNNNDLKILTNETELKKIIKAIVKAIKDYKEKLEGKKINTKNRKKNLRVKKKYLN